MAKGEARARSNDTDAVDDALVSLGIKVRALRRKRGLTLQELAASTGLSSSMLSMVERGRASPSIGTLVTVASALGVHMSALFDREDGADPEPVHRAAEQPVVETPEGVLRRLAIVDEEHDVEVVINEYPGGTASASRPLHHAGHEYGVVLEGVLTVEFDDASYHLSAGDAIAYSSETPHRLSNPGTRRARAVWINIGRG